MFRIDDPELLCTQSTEGDCLNNMYKGRDSSHGYFASNWTYGLIMRSFGHSIIWLVDNRSFDLSIIWSLNHRIIWYRTFHYSIIRSFDSFDHSIYLLNYSIIWSFNHSIIPFFDYLIHSTIRLMQMDQSRVSYDDGLLLMHIDGNLRS